MIDPNTPNRVAEEYEAGLAAVRAGYEREIAELKILVRDMAGDHYGSCDIHGCGCCSGGCECGAAAVGTKPYTPGHSSWCGAAGK